VAAPIPGNGTTRPPKQEQLPATEDVTEVAPGVVRLQLPIQMTGLGHVNMYALFDERGVAIVDPGMPGPISWRAVPKRLKAAGIAIPDVHTVIVTHSHPDHFGGAAQLASEAGADVLTHADFQSWAMRPHSHAHAGDAKADGVADGDDAEKDGADAPKFQPRPGPNVPPPWGGTSPWGSGGGSSVRRQLPIRRRIMLRVMGSRAMARVFNFPTPTICVTDGDVIKLAGREWTAVHTPGHTVDHLCLYDAEEGVILTGDHVLPTITPHISGMGSGDDPLRNFFESLDRVAALDGLRLALPAHGHPFTDVAGRVKAIKDHHYERLEKIREISAALGPATVPQFSQQLFRKERWGGMAESETYAHLEHLRLAGEADRRRDAGRLLYSLV
jgi:glyoxylase-like metal-dependent hydrolase (beta-lactamase superfamily II)